mgnify:CR=1 FL=1
MTEQIKNRLIERLVLVLGTPEHTTNLTGYFGEIDRMTRAFPANVLERAADRLLADAGRKWPTPKAIIDACVDAQGAIMATNASRPKAAAYPWELQAEQAQEWADRYMAVHPLADQAKREGWARELKGYVKSFARENLRVNRTPPEPITYRPPHDQIAYYRSLCGIQSKEAHR